MIIRVEIACGRRHCEACHLCEASHRYGHQLCFGQIPIYYCNAFPGQALEMDGRKPMRNSKCKEREES